MKSVIASFLTSVSVRTTKIFILQLLLTVSFLLSFNQEANSQNCSTCSGVTNYTVNISGKADTSWTVNSPRAGQCCQGSGSDNCIVFYVTVHPSATEIRFIFRNGNSNNGSYLINCTGTPTAPGTPMCLSGLSTFCITYCNPGGSSDDYTITTSSGFTAGPNITLRNGCTGKLTVAGLLESSLNWTSVYPGVQGAYNSYLSCTSSCDTSYVTPGVGAPTYIDYKVCGSRTGCTTGMYCDTQRVYTSPVMSVAISPTSPIICTGGPNQTLTANITGGQAPYTHLWSTGATTSSISVPVGTYTVSVSDNATTCPAVSSSVTVSAMTAPTVSAAADATICSGATYLLSGSYGGSATSCTWTTSGTGTFDNASLPNATYTPSAADITAGSRTLTLTANGPCPVVTDAMVLTINPAATVSAGADATICAGSTHALSGSRGGSASSSNWTTSGTGTFNNSASLTAIYTPSAADVSAGTVTLTLTTDDPAGTCTAVNDFMIITINAAATVNAGADDAICAGSTYTLSGSRGGSASTSTWSTSGTGTFDNLNLLTPIYTPSTADRTAGSVTLTLTTNDPAGPCPASNDAMVLTINAIATANAGSDATICAGSTTTLAGSFGGSAASSTWTTSGTGTFNNATLINAIYTPSAAEITAGSVTLTLTTNDPAGPCIATSDAMLLTINPAAVINAGSDAIICANSTYTLSGTKGGSTTTHTWSTSGTGTFNNTASLTAMYTPSAADILAGNVTLTITSDDPTGPCGVVTDNMILSINSNATANAGVDATICAGSTFTLSGIRGGSATASTWTTSGTGTFNNATLLNAIYTPTVGDISAGSVTITLTTDDPTGPCVAASDAMVLTINPIATVNAGTDATICSGSNYTLSGSLGGAATSSTWSTSGTGTFNDATQLNATYTPSAADITSGSISLTLTTNDPAGPCTSVNDVMLITLDQPATADAGANATICSGSTYTLSGSFGGTATSSTWSTSGTGTFDNASSISATYTPSAADITAGSVSLTLLTNDPTGPCGAVSDIMLLTINPGATVSAGSDATICSGTTHTLSGTRGGGATSSLWTTSGTGTFNNTASITATYTPSTADITAGSVVLTITSDDPVGICPAVSDQMTLTINPAATVNAGSNSSICSVNTYTLSGSIGGSATSSTWTTSGTGTFSNATLLNAVYTPSAADITAGSVTLTLTTDNPSGPCPAVSDAMQLTIKLAATASAGSDAVICAGSSYTLLGSYGGGASSSTWTSSGTGTFDDATLPTATYTPSAADITLGTVTLTITTDNPNGACPAVNDAMVLTINAAAVVNAGSDATICSGTTYTLAGSRIGGATTSTWTTSGTGTFSNAALINSTYTPSAADITAGSVILTITSNDPAGPCPATNDAMVLTINPAATVNAGVDASICSVNTYSLSGAIGGSAISSTWTTSGTGTFDNNALLTAAYTPSAADITAGTVSITLTTNDPVGPCPAVSDALILTINPTVIVNAGSDATICSGSTHTLSGTRGGGAATSTWTTSGTGTFSDASIVNAVYTPSAADITSGAVTLTLTTNDPVGPCPALSDAMQLTINPLATINAGVDAVICSGNTYSLSGTIGGGASSSTWTTSGTGTFNDATLLTAAYTPSAADIAAGSVIITLTTNDPAGPCSATSDALILTINPAVTVSAGSDATICSGNTYTLSGSRGGGASISTWTTSGTGTFNNAGIVNAIYTPSAADITSGVVTLTITTNNPAGPCPALTDAMQLTINPAATVNAGSDAVICSGTTYSLSGMIGGSATSSTWTTSGTGTFNNTTLPTAVYTPSAADITAGTVALTLTTDDPAGTCPAVIDALILTINSAAVVSAGIDFTICSGGTHTLSGTRSGGATSSTWTTSGTGTFSNATLVNAVYTPSPADITSGTVTLTITSNDPAGPCTASSDAMLLAINPTATVNAGIDASICSGSTYALSGSIGGSATSSTWTTSGTGTFDNATSLTAEYTPSTADITSGAITITLTTNDPPGTCSAINDALILTIYQAATVSAGSNATICSGSTSALAGTRGGGATSSTWTTSGTGTFSDASLVNPVYTPSAADITAGTVNLTITTNNPVGPCPAVSDVMALNINQAATVNAGTDANICSGNTHTLSGTKGGSATSSTWTSSGTGTFDDVTLLTAGYTPSAADVISGTVTLTITTNDPAGACPAASDAMVLSVNSSATSNAGTDTEICAGSTQSLSGIIGGIATSSTWSSSGTGSFNNPTLTNAIYTPSAVDITAGSVILTLTTNDPPGFCNAATDALTLTINAVPVVNAGSDITICSGSTHTLSASFGGGATSATWATSGTGSFSDITSPTATYTPSAADITTGTVNLTITTNDPAGSCTSLSDVMTLTINADATVSAGSNATICSGFTYTLSGTRGGSATSSTWTTSGTGTFDNATLLNAIYTPSAADRTAGSVSLTITTNDPVGPCPAEIDAMILNINQPASSNAGSDAVICAGSIYTLSGIRGGSATSSTWTTSGTGTFSDATSLTPDYTPSAADITAGTVTLTLTTDNPSGPCNAGSDVMILTINSIPTVNAGADFTICSGSTYTLSGTRGGGATSSTWTTSGTGTFNNAGLVNAVYTPTAADITAGTVTLTITTNDPTGPCTAVNDAMVLTINGAATVNAGSDAVICSGSTHILSATRGGSATSSTWSTSGTGTFDDVNILTAEYTPSAADITAGTVTLTITTDNPTGPCTAASDVMILAINAIPLVNAGSDFTICSGSTYTLSGTRGGGATSSTWTTSGTGTFSNATLVNAIYTPSSSDITAGTVTLTITTNDPVGPCTSENDAMVLTINTAASVNAGTDANVCSGSTYILSATLGGSATSSTWTTSGTGTFDDATILTAEYTPSAADISSGTVTLTITTNDPAGLCPAVSDAIVVTISGSATASAGSNASICAGDTYTLSGTRGGSASSSTWTTSGTGTFSNATLVNAIYTPSAADIITGAVTLTITTNDPPGFCVGASDAMILTINSVPTVTAGSDATICSGSTHSLSGSIGGGASSSTWSTSGSGTFNNASSPNAIYTPSATDITSGSVTLSLTTDDPAGSCTALSDVMALTINAAATVSAGADASICTGMAYTLSGTRGGGATTSTWTTSGTGTFSNATLVNAIYTPSAADISSGDVTLTLTTNDPAGPCGSANDAMILSIDPVATVNAGIDAVICAGNDYNLTGSFGGSASSSLWTSSGTGTFGDATLLTSRYTPSAADISSGSVTLTLTTDNPTGSCNATSDDMILTINAVATVDAGINATICSVNTYALSATRGGSAASSTWTTSGTGTFNNASLTNAIYTPSAADKTAGSVILTITTNDPAGPCPAASDALTLTINPAATSNAGTDATICSGSTINLSGTIGGSATSSVWITSGTGAFDDVTSLNPLYTPSASDISSGLIALTLLTNNPPGVCLAVSDAMLLTINPAATVNAGIDASICSGVTFALAGMRGGSATSSTWTTSGTGTFSDATLVNAVYTPSAADITAGNVTLTITTNNPAGICPAASDQMDLTIYPAPTVNAGSDLTICSSNTHTLSGSFGGGASSANWTSSGTGTFDDASLPTTFYSPSAGDITSGSVVLTLTTNDPTGSCIAISDALTLTINPAAIVAAGNDTSICAGSQLSLNGFKGGSATSSLWSTSGTGSFNNTSSLSAIYTPSLNDINAGLVQIVITTNDPSGICTPAIDTLALTITPVAIVSAGSDVAVCAGNDISLTGTFGGGATSATWTTSGTGTFDDANLTSAIYSPSASDISSGNITLTLTTNDPAGNCQSANDAMTVTINPAPTVSAGSNATICSSETISLNGSYGGSATSITWSSSGTGVFSSATIANPVYTPSVADIASGSVVLTLTTNNPVGPCNAADDNMVVDIEPAATANAGSDAIICSGSVYELSATFGGSASSSLWSTSGTGTFDNTGSLTATYTPSTADITAGFVNLTITTDDPIGTCVAAMDLMKLTINPAAIVNAGVNATICSNLNFACAGSRSGSATLSTWTTSGTGTFNNTALLNTLYFPSAADIAAGNVTLTLTSNDPPGLCPATSDDMVLSINQAATVNAGLNATICSGTAFTLSGISGGSATTTLWTTTGTGSFDDVTSLSAIYTPSISDITAGVITLTLTSNDPPGLCQAVADPMLLTINTAPVVNAGVDTEICSGANYTLAGTRNVSATSSTWTSSGTGTFNNATLLNSEYIPSAADVLAGTVTLTLTSNDPIGPCSLTDDEMVLIIRSAPTVNAGSDLSECSGNNIALSGTFGGGAGLSTWTTSGTGTFDDITSLTANYSPSVSDITAGTISLILTTDDPAGACTAVIDTLIMTIHPAAIINAGSDSSVCSGNSLLLNAIPGGSTATSLWSSSGSGTFDNATLSNAIYYPSTADITSGSVTLTATTNDPSGPCPAVSDDLTLTIYPGAIVTAGNDIVICSGTNPALNGSTGGGTSSVLWTTTGSGTFDDATSEVTAYTPSPTDISTGTVTLTLTSNDPIGPCAAVSDELTLIINSTSAAFSYAAPGYCQGESNPTPIITGTPSGSFSGSTGIVFLDAATGQIDLAASTPGGPYTITYTSPGTCSVSSDFNVTINAEDHAVFNYASGTICQSGSNPVPAITGTGGGYFSGPAQIVFVDNTTGEIDLAASTPGGPYNIIYYTPGSCPDSTTIGITISTGFDATFSYAAATYCQGGINPAPIFVAQASAGLFSASPTGLNFVNLNTGQIDLLSSTPGTYIVTNDIPASGGCPGVNATYSIEINETATVHAGNNQVICHGDDVSLSGSLGGSATNVLWSTNGSGIFDDSASVNTSYHPSVSDTGTVILTLTAVDPDGSGPCTTATSTLSVTINEPLWVNAGTDLSSCQGNPVSLNGTKSANTSSVLWTTSGSGTFNSNLALAPFYTPSTADVASGNVVLYLTSDDPIGPCNSMVDSVTIVFNQQASAIAGSNATICEGTELALSGTIGGGASTSVWTTNGSGLFADSSQTSTDYIPSASDITAGIVMLTLTTDDSDGSGPCLAASSSLQLSINPAAVVNAGTDSTICAGSTFLLAGIISGDVSSVLWTTDGTGTFNDAAQANAIYTPSANDISNGSVVLILTSNDPFGPCQEDADSLTILINQPATASAGSDIIICAGDAVTLNGIAGGSATTSIWSTNGTGSFDDVNSTSTFYTPSTAVILTGIVTLNLTTNDPDGSGPCSSASSSLTVTINAIAEVNAGNDSAICGGSSYLLPGTSMGSVSSVSWSSSGSGTFDDNSLVNATYTPTSSDISNGFVILTITSDDPAGPCAAAMDSMILTFNSPAVADAGNDITICSGSNINLSGILSGSATSSLWSTSGTGTFDDSTLTNATYIPSVADIASGSVTLTLSSNDPDLAGPCEASFDSLLLTIDPTQNPSFAYNVVDFCIDDINPVPTITGLPGGIFSDTTGNIVFVSPYTGEIDLTSSAIGGPYEITYTTNGVCFSTSTYSVSIHDAGDPAFNYPSGTFCVNAPNPSPVITGTAGGIFTELSGNLDLNDTTGEINLATSIAGTYAVTYATQGICSRNSTLTITITGSPDATFALSNELCQGDVNPVPVFQPGSSAGMFSASPTGLNFVNPNTGEIDLQTSLPGTYTILNSISASGACIAADDSVVITINPAATLQVIATDTICAGSSASLTATIGGSANAVYWTTLGSGTFDDATLQSPTYTPSITDNNSGSVVISVVTNDPDSIGPCTAAYGITTLIITPSIIVDAGIDQVVCENNATVLLNGIITGGSPSIVWTTSGSGSFIPDAATPNATYLASSSDIALGSVMLVFTSNTTNNCSVSSDTLIININPAQIAFAGNDTTITSGNPDVPLNGNINGGSGTGHWTTNGTGIFIPDNSTLNAVYQMSGNDLLIGTVTLTLTPDDTCALSGDSMIITYNANPILVNAGIDQSVCEGSIAQLNSTVINAGGIQWTTLGDGTFLPDDTSSTASYLPGINDISSGQAFLVTTSTGNGPFQAVTDTIAIQIHQSPRVDFVYNSACNLQVLFTDATTITNDSIVSWNWDFGDSATAFVQNPLHGYLTTGNYMVSLIVTSSNGCTDTAVKNIATLPTPVVAFSFSSGCSNDSVFFTDNSTIVSGNITVYNWNFGDSTSSAQQHPSHLYANGGTYNVTFTVTSDSGCTSSITTTVNVSSLPIPAFSFTSNCSDTISFTDQSTVNGSAINSWIWNFGDGNSDNQQNPVHTYSAPGTYDVVFTVASLSGCIDSIQQTINVAAIPNAAFTSISTCSDSVYFTDNSTVVNGNITSWMWNFGDGDTSIQQHPSHHYNATGLNIVTLTVISSSGCTSSFIDTVNVLASPQAGFNFITNCADTVHFMDASLMNGTTATSWNWNFGDGNSSSLQNPDHAYSAPGNYSTTLTIISSNGCADSSIQNIYVNALPVATFTNSNGCVGSPITFTDNSTITLGTIMSWNWDFGDSTSSNLQNPDHAFASAGTYNVVLNVVSDSGCISMYSGTITISAGPVATVSYNSNCSNEVTFAALTTDSIASWSWDFGDGFTAVNQNPMHEFNPGNYNITLEVMNALGCTGTVLLPLNISDITTSVYFPQGGNYSANNPISFTNQSTGEINWYWNFGDGNISSEENPMHTFEQPGIYSVTLITTGANGCSDTIAFTFEITDDVTVNPAGTIAIPSAFTPDQDGNNDILFVRGGPFVQMDFRVFNEWGNLLFHSTNQSSGWDGNYKGAKQPVGTYVWTLVGKTSTNKEIKMKGDVTILK